MPHCPRSVHTSCPQNELSVINTFTKEICKGMSKKMKTRKEREKITRDANGGGANKVPVLSGFYFYCVYACVCVCVSAPSLCS